MNSSGQNEQLSSKVQHGFSKLPPTDSYIQFDPHGQAESGKQRRYTAGSEEKKSQRYGNIDELAGGEHYTMIEPKHANQRSTGSVKNSRNPLYGRKPSSSGHAEAEDDGSNVLDLSSRTLQLLLAFLAVLTVFALGAGGYVFLKKTNDCSCSSVPGPAAGMLIVCMVYSTNCERNVAKFSNFRA